MKYKLNIALAIALEFPISSDSGTWQYGLPLEQGISVAGGSYS